MITLGSGVLAVVAFVLLGGLSLGLLGIMGCAVCFVLGCIFGGYISGGN